MKPRIHPKNAFVERSDKQNGLVQWNHTHRLALSVNRSCLSTIFDIIIWSHKNLHRSQLAHHQLKDKKIKTREPRSTRLSDQSLQSKCCIRQASSDRVTFEAYVLISLDVFPAAYVQIHSPLVTSSLCTVFLQGHVSELLQNSHFSSSSISFLWRQGQPGGGLGIVRGGRPNVWRIWILFVLGWPSAEIVRVGCTNIWWNANFLRPRATVCGNRACRTPKSLEGGLAPPFRMKWGPNVKMV